MKKEKWKKVRLKDVIEFDPKASLNKGIEYSFILMEDLVPNRRYVSSKNRKIFAGNGSKFKKGDILFARITPCLENGKISQVKELGTNGGFGSTEFIVFRNIDGVTDQSFIYYLALSDRIGKPAIKSMSGASGRQRANKSIIENIEMEIPPLDTQHKIAFILSAYDDLIENNTRRINMLEEMAQTIYREWFVKFKFPGYEKVKMVDSKLGKIPEGWEVKKVKNIVKRLKAGKTYTQKDVLPFGNVPVLDQSHDEFLGFHNNEPIHYASSKNPIIIFGDHTCKMQIVVEPFSLGPNVIPFIAIDDSPIYFLFFKVQNLIETREYKRHWNELIVKKVISPSKKEQIFFSDIVKPIFEKMELLRKKNLNLRHTRDLLLPKLISGEIDVEEL